LGGFRTLKEKGTNKWHGYNALGKQWGVWGFSFTSTPTRKLSLDLEEGKLVRSL
jgi:hypothetical protein